MAIEIQSGSVAPRGNTKRDRARVIDAQAETLTPPERAFVNFIPSPESLATLIDSAIAALRKGVRWDRGTILNLLV